MAPITAATSATAGALKKPAFTMSDSMRDTILVGALAFLSACLVATNIWENGDIELKWQAIKAWADFQFPAFPENHHNMRWGMNFPAVAWVRLFGDSSLSYLLLNHAVFALTSAGIYNLVRNLATPLVGAIAFLLWLVNPIAYDLPGNLMPEVWTMGYIVWALILLRTAYASNSRLAYAAAIGVMFLAYGAKETNIFFMPGLGLYEIIRRRWANVGIIIAVFGGGLVVETLTVNALLGQSHLLGGRAQAIVKAGHLQEMTQDWPYTWPDLFTRWLFNAETNLDRLEYFNKIIWLAFFGVTASKAWQWAKARTALPPAGDLGPTPANPGSEAISAAWAIGLSFAFFSTFFILSLNPLVLGQPLNDRYLWPMIVPVLLVLSVAIKVGIERTREARAGLAGFIGKLQRALTPLTAGRAALATLVVIGGFCTLARWPIELAGIKVRRDGWDQPYTVFTVNYYFRDIRQHLMNGCTLVFPRPRPAQTMLVHAFSFKDVSPTLNLYDQMLDGLVVDGRQIRAWALPPSDFALLSHVPHLDPKGSRPYAVRLAEGGPCTRTYYLGQVDINAVNQPLDGPVTPPPAAINTGKSL